MVVEIKTDFNIGDKCYIIADNEMIECAVQAIRIEYIYEYSERLKIQYTLLAKDKYVSPFERMNVGVWDEKDIFATKEAIIAHIDSTK